jgi:hypothetical protein
MEFKSDEIITLCYINVVDRVVGADTGTAVEPNRGLVHY